MKQSERTKWKTHRNEQQIHRVEKARMEGYRRGLNTTMLLVRKTRTRMVQQKNYRTQGSETLLGVYEFGEDCLQDVFLKIRALLEAAR